MIRIIADSTCDLSLEEAKALGVGIVPITTNIDGIDYKDRIGLSPAKFYDLLKNSEDFPKTSQPSPKEFLNVYEPYIKAKDEIIVIALTSRLSGTCQSAILAKHLSGYEEHIHVVDSQTGSHATKIIILKALQLIKEGYDFNYICEYLEVFKTRVKLFAIVDTLEYLHKGGRVSMTSAFVGSLLKFKPVLTVMDGKLEAVEKKRGMNKAIQCIVELIKKSGEIDFSEPAFVAYSGNNTNITSFIETMKENLGFAHLECGYIGPAIGSHTGPGAKLIAYVVK